MDSYLESLVASKKKAEEVEEVVEAPVEEAEEVEEETAEAVAGMPEDDVEAADADVEEDETDAKMEADDVEEDDVEQEAELDDDPGECESCKIQPAVVEKAEKPVSANEIGEEIDVESIKIFNTPQMTHVPKVFTGKVILKGEVSGFKAIDYVKPGFGLVRGYTQDI